MLCTGRAVIIRTLKPTATQSGGTSAAELRRMLKACHHGSMAECTILQTLADGQ